MRLELVVLLKPGLRMLEPARQELSRLEPRSLPQRKMRPDFRRKRKKM